jgi:tryptophan-rich sensory protein
VVTWRASVATPLRLRAAVARSAEWAAARASGDATAQVPYFIWVSIAAVLQLSITWMNRALG